MATTEQRERTTENAHVRPVLSIVDVGGSSVSVILSYFHICQVISKCITRLREATVNITI